VVVGERLSETDQPVEYQPTAPGFELTEAFARRGRR
jgi:hypothetical protein